MTCDASLSDSTISVLKKEGLDDLKILKLLPVSEISDLGITKGQALLLRTALKRLAVEDYDEASFTYSGYNPGQVVAVVLRGAMEAGKFDGYHIFLLALLSLSMVLQLAVAILLFLKSQVNVEEADDDDDDDEPNGNLAHKYNNWAMSLTLVIMADNVLISSLGIK
uniref:Uncharacterized protein n=1 Tax=Branchiostoma floridae TaxID=7739 RepID=C3Y358_BRAFL|eukprot:XP_002609460.1 hypothetical protein BRAFLDRAFT_93465 [Branchiostoma floridae]